MTTSKSNGASSYHPPGGRPKLVNTVEVRFQTSFLRHEVDAQELQLRQGEEVIIETDRGPALAVVAGHVSRQMRPAQSLRRVLRKANEGDLQQAQHNEDREREAHRFALERIRARKLPMKLVRAQYMHDGSKIIFFFSADGRIDFRDLVKDLAHRFRTRIEMYQIGVRDGARMIGGIGPCGRELCCSTFLENFAPVSIRMAKDQGLTLNPKKVSGMCGRLMCCLVYEQQIYKKMRKRLPRAGQPVHTPLGTGTILDVDVINERVNVALDDDNSRQLLPLAQIALHDPNAPEETVDHDLSVQKERDFLWGDATPGGEPPAPRQTEGRGTPRRSRRRRRRSDPKDAPKQPEAEPKKQDDQASKPATSRRRRRRRRSRGGGSSDANKGGEGEGG